MGLKELRAGKVELRLAIIDSIDNLVKLAFSVTYYPICKEPQVKRSGMITVLINSTKQEVCAELVATNWLLSKEKVFDDRMNGKNLQIIVSHEETYMTAIGLVNKPSPAHRYTQIFKTRFIGCEWLLETSNTPIMQAERPIRVGINATYADLYNVVSCPNIKYPLVISEHAQQRFCARNDGGIPKRPWQAMARMLSKNIMKEIELPEEVKQLQYDKHNQETIILNNGSAMHFVCTPVYQYNKIKYLMIVTVYLKGNFDLNERIETFGTVNPKSWLNGSATR
ncbi:hypothetical protein [Motilimonas eburnea]|uniref:hypothetical protein n=1 Tax=Motilimonas eburnea TaxID=1737488 RepID=UPI001E2EE680|nr:hypothetical protein [Motilimonas eburnea]MCE2573855.1 hypothetical protein [Motilimonas eburnea]